MFRRRDTDDRGTARGAAVPAHADPVAEMKKIMDEMIDNSSVVLPLPPSERWVYHVTTYDKVNRIVIATFHRPYRLGDQNMTAFYDNHPLSPRQPIFMIKSQHIVSIEVVREANRPEDEPVAAWTSASDPPRPEACSESAQ